MITKIQNKFCSHGFSVGFCPNRCVNVSSLEEMIENKRRELNWIFKTAKKKCCGEGIRSTKRTKHVHMDRVSIIIKLQNLALLEKYKGSVPDNLLCQRWQ